MPSQRQLGLHNSGNLRTNCLWSFVELSNNLGFRNTSTRYSDTKIWIAYSDPAAVSNCTRKPFDEKEIMQRGPGNIRARWRRRRRSRGWERWDKQNTHQSRTPTWSSYSAWHEEMNAMAATRRRRSSDRGRRGAMASRTLAVVRTEGFAKAIVPMSAIAKEQS